MIKNNYQIIVSNEDYPNVIEILNYFRIDYTDEFSIVKKPNNLDIEKFSKKYGFFGIVLALIGTYLSFLFLYWAQKINYPINIAGKELFDIVFSFPVIFEFVVLFVVIGMFIMFIFSNKMFHFTEIYKDKKTIIINNIYSIAPLKEKLKNYEIEINDI